jgi:hypothetical protein
MELAYLGTRRKFSFLRLSVIALGICLSLASCKSSKKRDNNNDDTAIRNGRTFDAELLKYYDAEPQISSDGSKLVFLSGRTNSLQVYRYERSTKKRELVFTKADEIGSAISAVIDTQASWVLSTAEKSSQVDIFARRFDGSGDLLQATDTAASETDLAIHPSGEVFAYTIPTDEGTKVYVGSIDATDGPRSQALLVTTESDVAESQPVWLTDDSGGPYRLVVKQSASDGYSSTLVLKNISIGGTTLSLSSEEEFVDLSEWKLNAEHTLVAAGDELYGIALNPKSGANRKAPIKVAAFSKGASASSAQVEDRPVLISDSSIAFADSDGIRVNSASRSENGINVHVESIPVQCAADTTRYASVLTIRTTANGDRTIYTPGLSKAGTPTNTTSELCKDSDFTSLDTALVDARINADATSTDFTVVYTSLTSGDHEVWLMDVNGEDTVFESVSANKD